MNSIKLLNRLRASEKKTMVRLYRTSMCRFAKGGTWLMPRGVGNCCLLRVALLPLQGPGLTCFRLCSGGVTGH